MQALFSFLSIPNESNYKLRIKMTSSTAFRDADFEEFRINFSHYQRGVRALAPPVPVGMALVLNGGSGDGGLRDHPIHPMYGAFCQALQTLTDNELVPLYMVYFGQIWSGGRRVKVVSKAADLNLSPSGFYVVAHNAARNVWKRAKLIHQRIVDPSRFFDDENN